MLIYHGYMRKSKRHNWEIVTSRATSFDARLVVLSYVRDALRTTGVNFQWVIVEQLADEERLGSLPSNHVFNAESLVACLF